MTAPDADAPNILVLCTGNATRSVIAGAVLQAHLPHVEVATGGTMSIDGLPMSWRTKAGFEAVGVTPPSHRSRQVLADDLDRATLIVGLAPEHVAWVRRTHPAAAARTGTLKRLVHDLADDLRPLAERVAELGLDGIELQPWEEVVDPGGGEVEAFIACAQEVVPLVGDLAARLRLAPAMTTWKSDDWKGERSARWIAMAEALDAQLTPVSDELFAAAHLRPGERVLDVGCGTGPTTRRAAELLAPDGMVVGADIATEMIEAARARTADGATIDWVTADVATWHPDGAFDVVISRFGVMFFDDPPAAFANLADLTVDGGRLCVAVWDRRDRSAFFAVPLEATVEAMARSGIQAPDQPDDEGPFALGDADRTVAMLERAGWHDVAWSPRSLRLVVGGGMDPDGAAALTLAVGPARIASEHLDDDAMATATAAVAERLAAHVDDDGHVVLGAAIGIITATR